MTLKKINILEYAFGEGGGGHQKAYAVYAFINVDNCERPLNRQMSEFCHFVGFRRIINHIGDICRILTFLCGY